MQLQLDGKKALDARASNSVSLHFARVPSRQGAHAVRANRQEELLRNLAEDTEALVDGDAGAGIGAELASHAPLGYIEIEIDYQPWSANSGLALVRWLPQGGRLAQAADWDGPRFLRASDASRQTTGSVLAVDGGHVVKNL